MKRGFPIIFLLLAQWSVLSQLHPLSIGDGIADVPLHVINGDNSFNNINQCKGKFTILDFWGTYCISCIEAMPKLDSLQKKFKSDLQIVMITQQPEPVIRQFLKKGNH